MTTPGDPLPDKITLSRQEAATVLFALDEAIEGADDDEPLRRRLEAAARILVERFLPDLPDL